MRKYCLMMFTSSVKLLASEYIKHNFSFFDVYYPLHSRWILNIFFPSDTYCVNSMYAMHWMWLLYVRITAAFLCTTGHKIFINWIALQEVSEMFSENLSCFLVFVHFNLTEVIFFGRIRCFVEKINENLYWIFYVSQGNKIMNFLWHNLWREESIFFRWNNNIL